MQGGTETEAKLVVGFGLGTNRRRWGGRGVGGQTGSMESTTRE